MRSKVKEIIFKNKKVRSKYFDLVGLESIYNGKPKDHNQFDHHKISFYVVLIITSNRGKHSINYKDYPFKKGTVFTLRKNNIHKFYKSIAKGKLLVFTEDFAIHFSDKDGTLNLLQLFNEMLGSPKLQLTEKEFGEVETLTDQIEKEYLIINDKQSIEIIRSLIQVLVLKLYRIKSKGKGNLVNRNYHLKFLSLQELVERDYFKSKKVNYYANLLGVTTRTLNNITQSVIGKNAKSFIDEVVILQIKRQLINSNYSLTEVAYQTGFDDPTNFFKYFRKKTGLSPKQFKKNFK